MTASLWAADIEIKAFADKTMMAQNQQFTLSVELTGKDAQSIANPKLPNTDTFASFLGSGSSQNIQFINGKMSVSKTITYHFMASEAGDFTIGPVSITHENKTYKTDPIQITIQKTATQSQTSVQSSQNRKSQSNQSTEDLYIRAEVDKRSVYPNEPVILTYKIYTKVSVTPAGISKLPGTAGFWSEEFDLPQQLVTTNEVIDGQRYTVATFKKMALFPTSPGEKSIEPLGFDCDVRVQQKRSRDPFDGFFNDSFFFGRTERKTLLSNPVKINVKPFPEESKPADFSGATGSFKISASVDKKTAQTNDAVTFKVILSGTGNIRTLPEPDIQIPADFEAYPPKISETVNRKSAVISGSRTYEYVLIPRNPGMQKIRSIRFSYFDPKSKSYKTLQTRELTVDVSQGDQTFAIVPEGRSRTAVEYLGKDIRFIITALPKFRNQNASPVHGGVIWLVLLLPLGALGLASAYQKHLQRLHGDEAYARGRVAGRAAKKHLAKARSLLNPDGVEAYYSEVSRALSSFAGNKLNIPEAGMMSEDVRKRLQEKGVCDEGIEDYFDCLGVCDRMRFSPTGADEAEMKAFMKRAEKTITDLDRQIK
ncbi:protein BatD [candidate division KSB1 bacterium]|nr:protein BatD [candidate division KSB1 bacterium]